MLHVLLLVLPARFVLLILQDSQLPNPEHPQAKLASITAPITALHTAHTASSVVSSHIQVAFECSCFLLGADSTSSADCDTLLSHGLVITTQSATGALTRQGS